ncbi:putative Transposon Tf2-1 polyprotein, partial [Rhizoctonia solani 123E]
AATCVPPTDFRIELLCTDFANKHNPSLLHTQITIPSPTAEPITTLIDSGASSSFISPFLVEYLQLPRKRLQQQRVVRMLDGSLAPSQITHYTKLDFLCKGRKSTQHFLICPIRRHKIILGSPWLREENPQINWELGSIRYEEAKAASEEEADDNPAIPPQYHQFLSVFGEEEFNKLPPHCPYDIDIELKEDQELGHAPLYSMTPAESWELKAWLEKEVALGKIQPSKSPIASPVMFVKKKDRSLQLVVDYQKLNEAMRKNSYPLPRQDDLMARLQGAKIFTKLDLQWGYNNVRVKEGDEWKTAFCTKYGSFETKDMPFGLTNAPAAFQHFMNDIFRDLLDESVVVYLDDILIFSKNEEEHKAHVTEVLKHLQENQLFCKASKCHFHVTTVKFLGIIITPEGSSMDKSKIEAIQNWPTPTTVKQVQSFLGFTNFLHQFIKDFTAMTRPLHDLIGKNKKWQWMDKEEKAFLDIKRAICSEPVLQHPNPDKPYFLETDASGVAMGAVLSQQQEDERLHPVSYMSKSFTDAEKNYNTHDKELLAIIKALEHWRIFLEGTEKPITVFMDHRNLEYWQKSRNFNWRHAQWHLLLANFTFHIHYQPGKQSGKPDALSRRSDHSDIEEPPQIMLPTEIFALIAEVQTETELQDCIQEALEKDESLTEILQFLRREGPAPPSVAKGFRDYTLEGGLLFYRNKIHVPDNENLKRDLIASFHDAPAAGHLGQQRTLELISRQYHWPGIRARVYEHVESCEECQRNRLPKNPSIPLKLLEVPDRPWQHMSYDMITGYPNDRGQDAILVIVDSFSKYGVFVPCSKKANTKKIAELFLEHWWKKFGLPEKTVSD